MAPRWLIFFLNQRTGLPVYCLIHIHRNPSNTVTYETESESGSEEFLNGFLSSGVVEQQGRNK